MNRAGIMEQRTMDEQSRNNGTNKEG